MKAKEIAAKAANLTGGQRREQYGDVVETFGKIAIAWNAVLEIAGKKPEAPIVAKDVANMMEALKMARRYSGSHSIDNYIDGAGYAACAGEIAERER